MREGGEKKDLASLSLSDDPTSLFLNEGQAQMDFAQERGKEGAERALSFDLTGQDVPPRRRGKRVKAADATWET